MIKSPQTKRFRITRRFLPFGVAFALFLLTVLSIVPVGRMLLERYAFKPGVIESIASSQTPVAFQGLVFQEKALTMPDILPVYGSSEFSAESEFHPSKIFDGKPDGFVPFLIGRGGSQSLVHVLSLAAQGETLRGKKIAVILSPQWFTPEGITSQYLDQNFSPLQAYQILEDPTISKDLKQEIENRLLEFPEVMSKYPTLKRNLLLDQDTMSLSVPRQVEARIAGRIEHLGLTVQDLYDTASFVPLVHEDRIQKNAGSDSSWSFDWDKLRELAQKQGTEATGNNPFGILDSYYTKYIEPQLAQNKGVESKAKLYPSPEYQDLQLLMKVLKEREAQALFVIVPVNGPWYDYIGFSRQERTAYYSRVAQMIKQSGFEVADFSGHEYDRNFLQDTMHIGWKGWVYIDEALDRFDHERS